MDVALHIDGKHSISQLSEAHTKTSLYLAAEKVGSVPHIHGYVHTRAHVHLSTSPQRRYACARDRACACQGHASVLQALLIHTYIYTYTYIHIHIHIHTYTHTHTPGPRIRPPSSTRGACRPERPRHHCERAVHAHACPCMPMHAHACTDPSALAITVSEQCMPIHTHAYPYACAQVTEQSNLASLTFIPTHAHAYPCIPIRMCTGDRAVDQPYLASLRREARGSHRGGRHPRARRCRRDCRDELP